MRTWTRDDIFPSSFELGLWLLTIQLKIYRGVARGFKVVRTERKVAPPKVLQTRGGGGGGLGGMLPQEMFQI